MAQLEPRAAAAPRPRGPWFFAGIWVVFWGLLALSGLDRFKDLEGAERTYAVHAAQLAGVTHLRIEGDPGETQGYAPQTRVVLGGASEVALTLQNRYDGLRRSTRKPAENAAEARPEPPIAAVREGDTLVLRWLPAVRARGAEHSEGDGDDGDMWIREITLPPQFQSLALSHALVEALEPLERLRVSGRSVEVRGQVAHLDLQSTLCGRCARVPAGRDAAACEERAQRGRDASLEVMAGAMQSVRIAAEMGQVVLKDTERLRNLELHLGDGVALSVDRAGVLRLASNAAGHSDGGGCAVASGPGPTPGPSTPLDLVPTGGGRPQGR
ncbi:hypothetical protein [Acidovorax sp. sic0104]|uniref:hypothetical protein n=1 Tax=Acidovorax sp. sic0104 TaxID=2854784 RepID=UPI001C4450FF|nr:hypothetical protein [Acidovorax sp. sic0104]MBV7540286.1 hypothetical protein [Acidovorax sp. sic0104]